MNKIDEQSDRLVHTPKKVVDASSHLVEASERDSRPMAGTSYSPLAANSRAASRRVWLRRGVAAASPVVASLVSVPVYAAGACIGAKSMGSMAANSQNAKVTQGVCTTQGPNYFLANFNTAGVWPTNAKTAKFKDLFGNGESGVGNKTLKEVLELMGNNLEFAKYSIAAYLNVMKATLNFPFANGQQVVDVYKSYRGGTFSTLLVSAPKQWSEAETLSWLKILMT